MDGLMNLPELIEWLQLHKKGAKLGGQLDDELVDMWCGEMQEQLSKLLLEEKKKMMGKKKGRKWAETRKTV